MPLAIREPHDLVFERRTVARANAANLTVVERTLLDVLLYQLSDTFVRVEQPAADSIAKWFASSIGERRRTRVSALFDKHTVSYVPFEIDARAIEPRGCSRLEPTDFET
jgi:hypothetical protein